MQNVGNDCIMMRYSHTHTHTHTLAHSHTPAYTDGTGCGLLWSTVVEDHYKTSIMVSSTSDDMRVSMKSISLSLSLSLSL